MYPHSNFLFVILVPLFLALALAVILVVRHGLKAAPIAIYAVTQVAALRSINIGAGQPKVTLEVKPHHYC